MTSEEFDQYKRQVAVDFAAEQIEAGAWEADEAKGQDKAWAQLTELAPQGPQTPGMLIFVAEDDDGQVGTLWLSLTHPREVADTGWVYDIEVVPERRGQGLGRALLAAGERELAGRGLVGVGLNVFGRNKTARQLYESTGYDVVAQQMVKRFS